MSVARRVRGIRLLVVTGAVMALMATLAGPANAAPAVKATATLSTTATPTGTVALGTWTGLGDTAILSGVGLPVAPALDTGTITFTLTGPANTTVYTDVVPTIGSGQYNTSGFGFVLPTPTPEGLYVWHASYSGDANNNAAVDQG